VAADGLEKAELVEKAAESLYRRLAAKFREHPMLCGLFIDLADEEREHARRVAMLRYQVRNDKQLAARIRIDTAFMDQLLRETEHVSAQIARSELSAAKAIQLAYALERSYSTAHAEVAAAADPWLREFFTSLAEDDVRHRAMLEALSEEENV